MNRKVVLYLRVLLADGRRIFAKPANASSKPWNGCGAIKQGHAMLGDRCERHDEGVYYLRYQIAGKRVWEPVGKSSEEGLAALDVFHANVIWPGAAR